MPPVPGTLQQGFVLDHAVDLRNVRPGDRVDIYAATHNLRKQCKTLVLLPFRSKEPYSHEISRPCRKMGASGPRVPAWPYF
jgi:hypothetical protein